MKSIDEIGKEMGRQRNTGYLSPTQDGLMHFDIMYIKTLRELFIWLAPLQYGKYSKESIKGVESALRWILDEQSSDSTDSM